MKVKSEEPKGIENSSGSFDIHDTKVDNNSLDSAYFDPNMPFKMFSSKRVSERRVPEGNNDSKLVPTKNLENLEARNTSCCSIF